MARVVSKAEWRAEGEAAKPDVSFVPMMERRRLTAVERAAFHVAHEAVSPLPEQAMPVVFASRWGEIGTTFRLMRQMHDEGEMSPAGFSSSVHNAMPGAWSLFTKNRAPYTAVAARGRTYEMGRIEAEAQLAAGAPRVLYVFAEEDTPAFYSASFGACEKAHAVAEVLEAE